MELILGLPVKLAAIPDSQSKTYGIEIIAPSILRDGEPIKPKNGRAALKLSHVQTRELRAMGRDALTAGETLTLSDTPQGPHGRDDMLDAFFSEPVAVPTETVAETTTETAGTVPESSETPDQTAPAVETETPKNGKNANK